MTDREKLIEMLTEPLPVAESPLGDEFSPKMKMGLIFAGKVADHLLANGVTFQKWIPVSERLPEHGKVVLVYGKRGAIYTAWCNSLYKNPGWHKLNSKSHYCDPTHWMPLPEPPEEQK